MSAPVVRIKADELPGGEGAASVLAFAVAMTLGYCSRPEVFPPFRRAAVEACAEDEDFASAMRTLTPEVLVDLAEGFLKGSSL